VPASNRSHNKWTIPEMVLNTGVSNGVDRSRPVAFIVVFMKKK
jgi:hypothetical protein